MTSLVRCLAGFTVSAAILAGAGRAGAAQAAPPTELTALRLTREGSVVVLTIQAKGALPMPGVGQVEGPIRVFLDFPNTVPRSRGIPAADDPLVERVRIALHSAKPLVTRVVLDLKRNEPFQVETDQLDAGWLRLTLGTGSAEQPDERSTETPQGTPELTPVPNPFADPPPTGSAGSPPPAPAGAPPPIPIPLAPPTGAPAADIERYHRLVEDPLGQLLGMRSLLGVIDRFASPPPEELHRAAEELERIHRAVADMQPPESLRPTHDLVVRASALGAMAVRLRAEANRTSDIGHVRNAGSAAAGAVMLLERVCTDINCGGR